MIGPPTDGQLAYGAAIALAVPALFASAAAALIALATPWSAATLALAEELP